MTNYNNNIKKINTKKNDIIKGLNTDKIQYLESKLNNGEQFPIAFKEYLTIGGDNNGLPLELGINYDAYYLSTTYIKKRLMERGTNINRPIAVFCSYEDCYSFIYLDEGNNPQPWNCSVSPNYDNDDGKMIWKMPFNSFKELIDDMVYRAIKGLNV